MRDIRLVVKKRDPDSHKGDNGKLLVIGGSEDFVGAPLMAALSALRTGIDWVTVAAPEKVAWMINSYSPDLITKKLEGEYLNWDNIKEVAELSKDFDCILIGNGIGRRDDTAEAVQELMTLIEVPAVIDADAIKALAGRELKNAVLTPHKKEFEIFTGRTFPTNKENREQLVMSYAKKDLIILLKGKDDIITDGSRIRYNKTGNPGMAVAGTGDILAGICAGFLAQSKDLFSSASASAHLNGLIGDYLYKKRGYGFIASDMIAEIPFAIKKMLQDGD